METIQAKVEHRWSGVRVRVWTWPDQTDLLKARLSASPQHPRAVMELLEAIARWEGRTVHAALVADESACSYRGGIFHDLLPEVSPLVQCDYVSPRTMSASERGALRLRGHGRDEQCLPFPAYKGVGR